MFIKCKSTLFLGVISMCYFYVFLCVISSFEFIMFKSVKSSLTHFNPVSHFYTPWKRQKTFGFLTFSGGMEMWHWTKNGLAKVINPLTYSIYSLFLLKYYQLHPTLLLLCLKDRKHFLLLQETEQLIRCLDNPLPCLFPDSFKSDI